MNLDDRLEALTQSVELLAGMHRENEVRIAANERRFEANEKRMERLIGTVRQLAELTTQIAEGTARLLHIAEPTKTASPTSKTIANDSKSGWPPAQFLAPTGYIRENRGQTERSRLFEPMEIGERLSCSQFFLPIMV